MTTTVHASIHVPATDQPRVYIDAESAHPGPVIAFGDVRVFIGTHYDSDADRIALVGRLTADLDVLADELKLRAIESEAGEPA